jgi:hypothetical protein
MDISEFWSGQASARAADRQSPLPFGGLCRLVEHRVAAATQAAPPNAIRGSASAHSRVGPDDHRFFLLKMRGREQVY